MARQPSALAVNGKIHPPYRRFARGRGTPDIASLNDMFSHRGPTERCLRQISPNVVGVIRILPPLRHQANILNSLW
jgi:hypothetical protein